MSKVWDIQLQRNPHFSLGVHIDHKAPYFQFHLPLAVVMIGRIPVDRIAFQYSLRFGKQYEVNEDGIGVRWVGDDE